ncbi:hypothetical protein H6F96_22415 [Microcoleus sp. FACHB-53]|nr:hypothetical protein [Microcoleus sp. FACHB-53]MBD2128248.1 hypothetical protein [Microcoleus sp. FACHB-1]
MFSEQFQGLKVAECSNYSWLCEYTRLDVLLKDTDGSIVGRPWLTIIMDSGSECMMGFHLGFDPPSFQVLALALRHAILPKHYNREYNLHSEWGTYGIPQHLILGGEGNMKFVGLEQIATQLGLVLHQNYRSLNAGVVERFLRISNTHFFSGLQGYTGLEGVNYWQADLTQSCLTLPFLERLLVRYIVDNYNQSLDVVHRNQTRLQRWQATLISAPRLLREEDLDI